MKRIVVLITILGAAAPAAATPPPPVPHDVCVNFGFGVPTRLTAPAWATWPDGPSLIDTSLDDPRWSRATARSFGVGGATATLNTRAVWANGTTGQEYLYLSMVSDLHPNSTTARDIFIGFHRANPGVSGDDTGVTGYVLQVHLNPTGSAETALPIAYCGSFEKPECTDGAVGSLGNWWRVFRDLGGTTTLMCGTVSETGEQFKQWNGTGANPHRVPPFTWLDNSVHAWKIGATTWAIQLRIKIATTVDPLNPAPISAGIEKGSTIWYEATETPTITTTPYMSIAKYPLPEVIPPPLDATMPGRTGVTSSICVGPAVSNNDTLLHPDLNSPVNYSKLTDLGVSPGDCDTGLTLGAIGARFNTAPPYDALTPFNEIKAVDSLGHAQANTMIAQVINTNAVGLAPISAKVQARFRLANWGAGPIGSDQGEFTDIRGGGAVCLPEGAPPCTAQSLASGQQMAVHFDWKLGDDLMLGASEYCSYGLTPPIGSGTCAPCMCDGTQPGCGSGIGGTGVAGKPCMKIHNPHECMFVELTSPTSDVAFVQASAYNNMNFAEMSTVAREALIDARKLPKIPGQANQDIYFLVMPRNMPSSVPAGTTVTSLIQNAAVSRALALSGPYLADIARLQKDDPAKLQEIIDSLAKQRGGQTPRSPIAMAEKTGGDDRIGQIVSAMRVMPNDDFARVGKMASLAGFSSQDDHPNDALVHQTVASLSSADAAAVVPTLEIYPFYKAANNAVYQPMTAFTLFLSHEATLGGVHYEIDGADKIAENVYHLQIPVGFARKIQVRAQALVGSEAVLPPGMPKWPCAGCACGGVGAQKCGLVTMVGNTAPGLIAGVLVIRRRRKKTAKAAKPAN